jgi:hypothetical protein
LYKNGGLLRDLFFVVSLGGIPTRGQGVRHVEIFVGTKLSFHFNEIGLGMRLGPHGKVDGLYGLWNGVSHPQIGLKYSN